MIYPMMVHPFMRVHCIRTHPQASDGLEQLARAQTSIRAPNPTTQRSGSQPQTNVSYIIPGRIRIWNLQGSGGDFER